MVYVSCPKNPNVKTSEDCELCYQAKKPAAKRAQCAMIQGAVITKMEADPATTPQQPAPEIVAPEPVPERKSKPVKRK